MSFATTVPCEVALSFLYSKELGVPKKHLSQNHCKMAIPCGCSSVGRAQRCQRCCREFESHHPLLIFQRNCPGLDPWQSFFLAQLQ